MKLLPYVAAAVFYLTFIAREAFTLEGKWAFGLFDDAMISMTYARNLAEGHGLRWHAALPPVEGYTNFLWTVLMAGVHALGFSDTWASLPIQLLGAALLLTAAWYTGRCAEVLFPARPIAKSIAVVATLFFYPLVFWTLRGMEVGLLAALLSAATFYSLTYSAERRVKLAVAIALMPLVRDDALIACFLLCALTAYSHTKSVRERMALFASLFLCALLPFFLHLAGRKLYYGEWLPNTYFLKMRGLSWTTRLRQGAYLLYAVTTFELWPFVMPVFFLGRALKGLILPLALVAGQAAYHVYVGGDAWEWMHYTNRHLAIAAPALILLFVAGTEALLHELQRRETQLRLLFGIPLAIALGIAHWGWNAIGPFPFYFALAVGLVGGLGYALTEFRSRAGVVTPASWQYALAIFVLFAVGESGAYLSWGQDGAKLAEQDAAMAKLAREIAKCTRPETKVAVTWAGAIPYFSRRLSIDVLGKNDPYISRLPAQNTFIGHNKWNLRHSIGEPRPELVVLRIWSHASARELAQLDDWGYLPIGRQIYVLPVPQTEECLNVRWDQL